MTTLENARATLQTLVLTLDNWETDDVKRILFNVIDDVDTARDVYESNDVGLSGYEFSAYQQMKGAEPCIQTTSTI